MDDILYTIFIYSIYECRSVSPCLLQGHVFSLGSTLSAALDFVIEPELQAELGEEALRLLELMQAELPDNRPRPQVHTRSLAPPSRYPSLTGKKWRTTK